MSAFGDRRAEEKGARRADRTDASRGEVYETQKLASLPSASQAAEGRGRARKKQHEPRPAGGRQRTRRKRYKQPAGSARIEKRKPSRPRTCMIAKCRMAAGCSLCASKANKAKLVYSRSSSWLAGLVPGRSGGSEPASEQMTSAAPLPPGGWGARRSQGGHEERPRERSRQKQKRKSRQGGRSESAGKGGSKAKNNGENGAER